MSEKYPKSTFKCGFDMFQYGDIVPSVADYMQEDVVLNLKSFVKGDIEDCYWRKHIPLAGEEDSEIYHKTEIRRIFKTGVWMANYDTVVWIPPQYYFALQYGMAGSGEMEFRLKRLKHVYEKIRARNNPNCNGTLTIKNRADGETTMAINDAMFDLKDDGKITGLANIGIQSKTREDAINPCWQTAQLYWGAYPQWIKNYLYPDFSSGDKIEQKMKFTRDMTSAKYDAKGRMIEEAHMARNITFQYYPCVYNAMDGRHNMKRCILDEVCKWNEAEFKKTYLNYLPFINPGFKRKGLFDMFSSPADSPNKSNEQVAELWDQSEPKFENGLWVTESGIHRIFSNPLDGIEASYDKYGDADPQRIHDKIMKDRKNASKDDKMGIIRACPLNRNEMFESFDAKGKWANADGIESRKIYLLGTKYKSEKTKEPTVVYGNLEWKNGVVDSDVVFRQSDNEKFNEEDSRFGFAYMPQDKEQLSYGNIIVNGTDVGVRPLPPKYVENVLGIDPYAKRYRTGNSNSNGAMVNHKFRDVFETGIVRCPTMLYIERPTHADIFHEDAIKAAVFNRAMVQPESITDKIIDYFEDRGYMDWLLAKIGHRQNSLVKGDAPTGGRKNTVMDEIIGLMDAITNVPLKEGDPYPLEYVWFYELLDSVSNFNRKDTHQSDAMMAWGQALLGAAKLLHIKPRSESALTNAVFAKLFG